MNQVIRLDKSEQLSRVSPGKGQLDEALLDELLSPIPGTDGGGEDLTFSIKLDEIRNARREDDATLSQGEWTTDIKTAQWPKVRDLCQQILCEASKDLQVAAWYTEALTKLHGFDGLAFGLRVIDGLIDEAWDVIFPACNPGDLEERVGKIEWLNKRLAHVVKEVPVVSKTAGGYSWFKWDESRATENLGLRDPDARVRAVEEGKLTGEQFDKAVAASGLEFYQALHQATQAANAVIARLQKHIDERFGTDAPSLNELRAAVGVCADLATRLHARLGGGQNENMPTENKPAETSQAHHSLQPVGNIRARSDAVRALRDIARFFRETEPHSPVAFLVERAAKWAEMPLDSWLASVIKDEPTLNQLRELLDVRRAD